MKRIYINPEAIMHSVTIAVLGDEPLQFGQEYELPAEHADALLASGHWIPAVEVAEPETEAPPASPFTAVSGIGNELAMALHYVGIHTKDDLRKEVEQHGIERLLPIPGISKQRAEALRAWAVGDE
jgi:predicted flap endonuclease-1-like 5' DNA nuclease